MNGLTKWAAEIMALIALCAVLFLTGFWLGTRHEADKQQLANAKQLTKVVGTQTQQASATSAVVSTHAAAVEKVRTITKTVTKEVRVYVQDPNRSKCSLDASWVRIADSYLSLPDIPTPAREPDAAPAPITTDDALDTVVANAEACVLNAADQAALQDWVRQQRTIFLEFQSNKPRGITNGSN